jgi:hypothetical protein
MNNVHSQHTQAIPSLDGIRAISVLIVVLAHSGLEALVPGGLGVTIFFFLSGFLITTLMLAENRRTGNINILKFYARRMFRLMPPLFISLAIAYCLTYVGLLSGGITIGGLVAQIYILQITMVCFSIQATRSPTAPVSFGRLQSKSIFTLYTRSSWLCCLALVLGSGRSD